MDWKKLACMLAIGLMAVGCGDDDTDTTGDDPGDDPPMPLNCGGADAQCLFVGSTLAIGVEDPDTGAVPGFDIDDRVSDSTDEQGCFQEDWTSPSGTPGIDNQLATLAPTLEAALGSDLQETIDGAIADGSIIILMDVKGLESTNDDITMDLSLGSVPDGATLELNGTAIAAGQTFNVDMTYVSDAPGTVSGGVMTVSVATLPLAIPFDEETEIALTIRDATVRATVTETPTLSGGLIGGSLNIDELVTTVMAVAPDIDAGLIRTTLEGVADLEPDGDGICQNVSVGITFEGVEANAG